MKKSKAPEFTVTARIVMVVEATITGEETMGAALDYARQLAVSEWAKPNEDCSLSDASVLITGVSGEKHYDTEQ